MTYAYCQTCKTGHLTGAVCSIQSTAAAAAAAAAAGDTADSTDDDVPFLKPKATGDGGRAAAHVKGAGKSSVAGNTAATAAGGV